MRRSTNVVRAAGLIALSFLTVERMAQASAESPMRPAADRAVALAGPRSGLGGSIFTLAGGGPRPARAGLLAAEVEYSRARARRDAIRGVAVLRSGPGGLVWAAMVGCG
jgi:hypothetical protein